MQHYKSILISSLFILSLVLTTPTFADFDKAKKAYDAGDFVTAFMEFLIVAEEGNAKAQSFVGYMYMYGKGAPKSMPDAIKWLRLSADQENADAQNNLGNIYAQGVGVKKNKKEAFRWHKLAAEQGLSYAQYNLGNAYYNGKGIKKNRTEAARLYQLASDQNHPQAQTALAKAYYDGKGVKKNRPKAAELYRIAAEKGNMGAQVELGKLYAKGKGVAKDKAEAERLYRIAAEQGFRQGQYQLATLLMKKPGFGASSFSQGIFENSNYKYKTKGNDAAHVEGYAWLKKSVQGTGMRNEKMNFNLKQESLRSITLLRGERLFNEWMGYKKIIDLNDQADQGHAGAQLVLGNRHAEGDGVLKNIYIAYHWYNLAYANGHQGAKRGRDKMCRKMIPPKDAPFYARSHFDNIMYMEIEYLEAHPNAFNGKIRTIINNLCS